MMLRSILTALLLAAGVAAAPTANAVVIMSVQEVGSDVVATASGSFNPQGLMGVGTGLTNGYVHGAEADISFGSPFDARVVILIGALGPRSIGTGPKIFATSFNFSGLPIAFGGGVGAAAGVLISENYVVGSRLDATMTFPATTLAGLGLTVGTYTWTWGSGENGDSATLYLGVTPPEVVTAPPEAVPAPASLLLLATGVATAASLRSRRTS